ncbi:MAG: hypothetical protein ACJA0Q_001317 [Saprospiraceae bacterium]|jgi:hypothetical protein
MNSIWEDSINKFIDFATRHDVKMILVGGGAVNFHGYQRHSADVDFWLDTTPENIQKLVLVFNEMGYQIDDFPEEVKNQEQNISVKFSPADLNLELITKFSVGKSFDEAYSSALEVVSPHDSNLKWKVISYDDLITSKVKSNRPKDLLDILELKKRN